MTETPENHTIRLLQELRAEMREGFARIDQRFLAVDARFDALEERFNEVDTRIDGLTYILTLLAGRAHDHEDRLSKLERP